MLSTNTTPPTNIDTIVSRLPLRRRGGVDWMDPPVLMYGLPSYKGVG
jgi:hypothetical protein